MTAKATVSESPTADPLLRLRSVTVAFGGLVALNDIDLDVVRGERLAILGPNGAGKTTLFNSIAGDLTPTKGTIEIKGVDCTALPSRRRPELGLARTYQKTRLFGGLSVEDNLYLAQTGKAGRHRAFRRTRLDAEFRERARQTVDSVWLTGHGDAMVADLAHGQRRQLEVGMALVTEPDIMMLDEPASGLSRGEREQLTSLLGSLDVETTLLLIEHDMDVALKVATRVYVMADGETIAQGTPDEIRHDPLVHEVYLGVPAESASTTSVDQAHPSAGER